MSATPRPWFKSPVWSQEGIRIFANQGPLEVCPAVAHSLPDAALIVRAVNQYDDLVACGLKYELLAKDLIAALERIAMPAPQNADVQLRECREIARAALAAAKGDPS